MPIFNPLAVLAADRWVVVISSDEAVIAFDHVFVRWVRYGLPFPVALGVSEADTHVSNLNTIPTALDDRFVSLVLTVDVTYEDHVLTFHSFVLGSYQYGGNRAFKAVTIR